MLKEIIAKLVLSKEEIAHLYQGGVLSVKIKGKTQMPRWRYRAGNFLNGRARESVSRLSTLSRRPLPRNSFQLSRILKFFKDKLMIIGSWMDKERDFGRGKLERLGQALLPELFG